MKWMRNLAVLGLLVAVPAVMTACDDDDPSGPEVVDPPAAPSNVAIAVTGQSMTVTWAASSGADSYTAILTTDGESDRTQNNLTNTEASFTNLTPGRTYFAQVTATNTGGTSAPGTATGTTEVEPETVVQVTQDILTNTTWTSDKTWVLAQPVFVGQDCGADGAKAGCVAATLTIEPGTTILGKTEVPQGVRGAYLIVSRGSRLVADATGGVDRAPTEAETIVFTSDKPRGQRAVEDWGGIVINGAAPTNAGDEAQGEGDSGFYGGTDVNDDSGILRGVRIEFAGDDVTPTDQLNGLALQGVGAGTTISYLQIHYNKDDGIEPFGGTVSIDHLVVTGIGDDSVDGTDGYRGFMQFILGQQRGADADNGFEISNNGDVEDAEPKSTAVLANATMIGARTTVVTGDIAGAESDDALQFREGSHYRVYNSIFQGFGKGGFCIDDAATLLNAQNRMAGQTDPTTTLSAEGLIMWSNEAVGGGDENFACGEDAGQGKAFFEMAGFSNMLADPGFDASAFNMGTQSSPPDFTLTAMPGGYTAFDLSGIAFDANLVAPVDGRTLVDTDYAGAVAPGTALASAWYYGWTVWTSDGTDSRPNADGN